MYGEHNPTRAGGSGRSLPPLASFGGDTQTDGMPSDIDSDTMPRMNAPRTPKYGMKPRSRRRLLLVVGAALVVLVLGGVAAAHFLDKTPHVTLYTVQQQKLNTYIGGGGLTNPARSVNVVYPVSAIVTDVNVQVGQSVKQGQPLIALNSDNLNAQLAQAKAQWQNAQNYVNQLYASGATPATIASAQQIAANAKANYDALNTLLNSASYSHGKILSPFDGTVTQVNVTAGTIANAGTTLVTVADLSSIIVRAQLPIQQFNLVQLGQQATVTRAAAPGQQFNGTVTTINPILTSPGISTFEVWITVPNTTRQLLGSESVYARVLTTVNLPAVPEVAVINPDGDSTVFVYSAGKAHLRHVTVAARDGDMFGISDGLQPGDQVILIGQFQLHDNQPVVVG